MPFTTLSFVACRLIVYQQFRRTTSKRCMYANASRRAPLFFFPRGLACAVIVRAKRGTFEGEKVSKNPFLRRKPASSSSASVSLHPELLSVIERHRLAAESREILRRSLLTSRHAGFAIWRRLAQSTRRLERVYF